MNQSVSMRERNLISKLLFLIILYAVLMIVPWGFAADDANQFNSDNAGSASSDSQFYRNTNDTSGKTPAPFTASIARNLADGLEVTATGSQYPIKIKPITLTQGVGSRSGDQVIYTAGPGVQIIYTFKKNGVKEDIVFDQPSASPLDIAFRLELDAMLEARPDNKGNILIYGPNSILSGFIQTGDEKSAELIIKARQRAPKDNLLYIIPAPIVIDSKGIKHKNIARYSLEKSILTLHIDNIADVPAPVSIDPSIVVTTTADFMKGNNEGMISFDVDAISRAAPSGGSIGNWTATNPFPITRYSHTSVAYNGYLYMIGGYAGPGSYLNTVHIAPINANGTIGAWTATTSFTTGRCYHTSVVYNGYLYVIGGWTGSVNLNDVQYASINANGTIGSWTATTSFPTVRQGHTSVAYNGYLYVIGGYSSTYLSDVQFAPFNANGTIGSWTATTSFPTACQLHTSVAYNGYLYVLGGSTATTILNDVRFAPINANGTVGSWIATSSFTSGRYGHTSVVYNSYLYVIGGSIMSGNVNDVQFAPVNANGTVSAWTATTSFPTARRLHTSVVYNGYLYVIGGYSISYGILNDVQVVAVNANGAANGTIGSWTTTTPFPTAREYHASVAYNSYLYVIGGYSGSYLNDVQFAHVNANGTIGSWTATTSFTTARQGHTSVVYNGYLYVLGGWIGSGYLNDVQFAPINANGTLGSWTTTSSFTTARQGHTSVIYNGFLYVIGGYNSSYLNDVQFAPVNPNGTIGVWTATTSIPSARAYHASAVYNGYLYIIGGTNGSNLNEVQFASVNADGTVGAWTATMSLPTARQAHAAVIYNGYLYIIGGYSSSNLNDVLFAPVNADGTVGAWTATTGFISARYSHTSVVYSGYLYVLGGTNGSYFNDVQFAPVNASGTIGSWTATTSFITVRSSHTSVAYNGYLYVIGGYNNGQLNDVQFAPISADGTIGAWSATTSLALARHGHTSVAYHGYLYVIGGDGGPGGYRNDVQFAPINANDGTIGAWTATTSFTTGRYFHTSVAYHGYLYVIGGSSPGFLNDVQFAPINANGTIGAWSATTSLPTARVEHTSVIYNDYLYVIGGADASDILNDVQFAPVNADGTVGTWTPTTSFTAARYGHTSVAYNGYLYVIGGYTGFSILNDVQFAPINVNGTVGTWTSTTSFTTPRVWHTSVAYNGYLYVIGGWNGSGYINDVQFATLQGPVCRAAYSKLVDIGSDQFVESIQFSNSTTLGITNLTYTVAPSSTSVFGTRTTILDALPSLPYTAGLNTCGRYVWARFDLDDTLSATIGGGEINGRSDILDFTITYSACCSAPSGLTNNTAVDVDACTDTGVRISWSQNPTSWGDHTIGTRTYDVLRNGTAIASGLAYGTTTFTDTTGTNGTAYTYTVRYNNGCAMNADTTGVSSADTIGTAPADLTNNSAADLNACADTGVIITWAQDPAEWGDGGSGTRTYDVLRDGIAIISGLTYGITSFIDTTGTNEQIYAYTVRYSNGCALSTTTTGAPAADLVATAPSGLSNNTAIDIDACADTGVLITWSQNPANWGDNNIGIRTYDVLRDGIAIVSGLAYGTTAFIDTTGTNGQAYNYAVRYTNGCALSDMTTGAPASDLAASAPSGLTNNTAVDLDGCTNTGVRVTWAPNPTNWSDNNTGTRTYDVLRDGITIVSGLTYGTTSFIDATGTIGQTYAYTVRYNNGCALSSITVGAQSADLVGTVPTGLANNTAIDIDACADTGIRVTWSVDPISWGDNGSGTRTYDVLRDGIPLQTGIAYGATGYTDSTGNNGTAYIYSVRYNNGCGLSATTAGVIASDEGYPPVVTSVVLSAQDPSLCGDTGVAISWSADPDDWGGDSAGTASRTYDIMRNGIPVITGLAYGTTTYTDISGSNDVTYAYSVRYNNKCNNSNATSTIPGTDNVGSAPTGLSNNTAVDTAVCADEGVRITWAIDPANWGDHNSGTRTYDVLRNGVSIATSLSYGTTFFIDLTGVNGTTYQYKIRYKNGCGIFATTSGASAADAIGAPPFNLTNNIAIDANLCTDSGVQIIWAPDPGNWGDTNSGTRTYHVLRDGISIATNLPYGATSFIDSTGQNGTSYTYSISYNNGCGLFAETPGTSGADVMGAAPSGIPNNAAADVNACADTGVATSWVSDPGNWGDNNGGTRTFDVLRDGSLLIQNIPYGTTLYIDTAGTNGVSYAYTVRYNNGCGFNGVSAPGQSAADNADLIPCPGIGNTLLISKSGNQAQLTWQTITCADFASYKVYGSNSYDPPFPSGWLPLGYPLTNSFTDSLSSGTNAYKIVSLDTCGNE